jgi:tRNA (mo5U34)-methyltransferase
MIRRRIEDAKRKLASRSFEWYPYNSLSSIAQIERVATPDLLERMRGLPLLDLGCGDGDLAFYFESLGFSVTAVDHELTNYNQMRGVRALREALGSKIDIQSADLDGRFRISGGPFGLCLLLGLLYHLKNPFYVLEYAAQKARYCVLSTRIARRTPRGTPMAAEALAYLVDSAELNGDPTNFWIFSPEGLKRLATRAGWNVVAFVSSGEVNDSDPVKRDERAWVLLESRIRHGSRVLLGRGWHDLEEGTHRWTEPEFSVAFSKPPSAGAELRFRFTSMHPMTLSAEGLPAQEFAQPGEHVYTARVPENFQGELKFRVDPGLRVPGDERHLGVLVSFWREGFETTDENVPLEILTA